MPSEYFKPHVSLGDLLVLAKFGALNEELGKKPSKRVLSEQLNAGGERMRGVFDRIKAAVGTAEIETKGTNRTGIPSEFGRSIGAVGVLADAIIKIAQDQHTDQVRLRLTIEDLVQELHKNFRAGSFKKPDKTAFNP